MLISLMFILVIVMLKGAVKSETRQLIALYTTGDTRAFFLNKDVRWKDHDNIDLLLEVILDQRESHYIRMGAARLLATIDNDMAASALVKGFLNLLENRDQASEDLLTIALIHSRPQVQMKFRKTSISLMIDETRPIGLRVAAISAYAANATVDDIPMLCFLFRLTKIPSIREYVLISVEHAMGMRFRSNEAEDEYEERLSSFEAWMANQDIKGIVTP